MDDSKHDEEIDNYQRGTWGAEFDGGLAEPGRARALGRLVEDLFKTEVLDADAAARLTGRHSTELDNATALALVRDARRFISYLEVALVGEPHFRRPVVAGLKAFRDCPQPKRLEDIAKRRRNLVEELQRFVRGESSSRALSGVIFSLDHSTIGRESPSVVETIANLAVELKQVSLTLAAAKLSVALRMFDDHEKAPGNAHAAARAAEKRFADALKDA